jgi:hypothetical protein
MLVIMSLFELATTISQTVILIRHGEKNGGNDLSPRGYQRADCLANLFSKTPYSLSHLYAYTDKASQRSTETLSPLSNTTAIPIDTQIKRDDVAGLVSSISKLGANAEVLVCWEHKVLSEIATALGFSNVPSYPSDEYDLMWTVKNGKFNSTHENC